MTAKILRATSLTPTSLSVSFSLSIKLLLFPSVSPSPVLVLLVLLVLLLVLIVVFHPSLTTSSPLCPRPAVSVPLSPSLSHNHTGPHTTITASPSSITAKSATIDAAVDVTPTSLTSIQGCAMSDTPPPPSPARTPPISQ